MLHSYWNRASCLCVVTIFLMSMPLSSEENPEAMAETHRWVAAKFLGEVLPKPAEGYLMAYIGRVHC